MNTVFLWKDRGQYEHFSWIACLQRWETHWFPQTGRFVQTNARPICRCSLTTMDGYNSLTCTHIPCSFSVRTQHTSTDTHWKNGFPLRTALTRWPASGHRRRRRKWDRNIYIAHQFVLRHESHSLLESFYNVLNWTTFFSNGSTLQTNPLTSDILSFALQISQFA
jgi:hypothetical protein